MNAKLAEVLAGGVTVAGILAALISPFAYQQRLADTKGEQRVTLTGVAASAIWTSDEVTGGNYWYGQFTPAHPVLHVGRPVVLDLKSSDVIHTLYCPELGIGPVEVYPGHLVEVRFTPQQPGTYEFYCMSLCGGPHFGMRGEFAVIQDGQEAPPPRPRAREYWKLAPPRRGASRVERGKWIFNQRGCFLCHGEDGKGGVRNFNYVRGTVPALNGLAEIMKLDEAADAAKIISELELGAPLEGLKANPPIGRFNLVLAQYQSIRETIRKGSVPLKKDPKGPVPPLEMPAWGQLLTDSDIDSVIAYLLTLQQWEDSDDATHVAETQPPPPPGAKVKPLQPGDLAPDAVLTDQNGKSFHLGGLKGKVVVLAFIYTKCTMANMCPAATTKLVEAQKLVKNQFANPDDVQFLLVSFDTERDRPQTLKDFVDHFGVDAGLFRMATGEPSHIGELAQKFNTFVRQQAPGVFEHNIVISILDRKGILRKDLFGTAWSPQELVAAIDGVARL